MYVCICKNVTDTEIKKAVFERRVRNMKELRTCLGACTQCGKCATEAKQIVKESANELNLLENHSITVN